MIFRRLTHVPAHPALRRQPRPAHQGGDGSDPQARTEQPSTTQHYFRYTEDKRG